VGSSTSSIPIVVLVAQLELSMHRLNSYDHRHIFHACYCHSADVTSISIALNRVNLPCSTSQLQLSTFMLVYNLL
jgi:hypothetical protein